MNYKKINSKIIIANLFDDYNIDYGGFIQLIPSWIYRALREIRVTSNLIPSIELGTVVGYKCAIPTTTQELIAVSYNGLRLPRIDVINESVPDDMANLTHPIEKYQLDDNGNIITTFETGSIKFYIKSYPSELDTTTGLYFPLIADDEELINAISNYVLSKILGRGHTITGLSLRENNPFTNPRLAWEQSKPKARNSLMTIDDDDRHIMSILTRNFIADYNRYNVSNFNPFTK